MNVARTLIAFVLCSMAAVAVHADEAPPALPASPALPAPLNVNTPGGYGLRDDVRRYAQDVAARRQLNLRWVETTLAQARYQPSVTRLIMPAATPAAKNWAAYRARFIDDKRLRTGLDWWQANERWLQRAEQRFGVPAEIIVSIVGVETFYGRIMGRIRVLDALATLSFDFPTGRSDRSAFFRDELENFLVLSDRQHQDALTAVGSYAGAMGLPQFMPGSLVRHGLDFDEDGRIDLDTSPADAIGSVAQYLVNHGWQSGLPTHYAVEPPTQAAHLAMMLAPDITPTFDAADFAARGATLEPRALRYAGKLALVRLENGGATPSYVAGTQNFYVVTRYNWSSYYALAVIQFAGLLRAGHDSGR